MFDPLATLTETLTATMTGAASATASATGTGTLFPTLTLTPEPPLPLLLAEDFANPYQPDWDYAAPVTAFVDGGFLIRFYSNWAIRPRLTELTDAAIDVQVRLTNGTVMLFTHVSSVGAYRLTLTAQGQATLYRGATIMATATVSVPQSTWFDLRFSAIGGVLHGFLNGTEIITYTDTAPLPPGRLLLGARDLNGGNIQMDNVTLYGNVATAPASFQAEAMAVAPASGGDPVQPPPPNTVIVFDVDMGGSNREIFRINPDGTGRQQLTFNSAYDSDATLSPDGQKVAFVSNRDGNSNIYVMNIDGSNATPLTTHPADDYSPSWSPLGDRIAYVSTRSGELALYHIGSTQGDSVTPTPVLVGAQSPSWSPDGSQLAVSYPNPQNNSSDIYTVGKNGGVPTYRSGTAIANDHAPSWSPDGRWVAFASTVFSSVIGPNGESETTFTNDVLQIDLNNSSAVSSRYTAGFYDFMSPDWSPVGSQLVLQLGSGLHILPWSSSQPYRINDTYGTDGSPDWGIAAPLPATPTPTVLFSTPPPQSTSISETDYYEQFRGIAFWAIYNESNSNSQIPFSQVLPNSTPTISNTLALDHRYVMARVILNIIPLGDVRAGVNAMNRWGGSINETSYVLWQGVIPACQWQGSSIGTYSDARQAGATEVLRWMRGYAECHRTGNPLANARLGFDTAWNEIDAQITLAIQHKSQGNADPTSGAQYVKHTSSCFVWNRENNLVTSCRGNRGRIDMNAFCNERPNRPGDPTSPANRACTATGINPGNIDLSQWLVSSEGTSSNQQLGLDTTVGVAALYYPVWVGHLVIRLHLVLTHIRFLRLSLHR
jgi:TolB protein